MALEALIPCVALAVSIAMSDNDIEKVKRELSLEREVSSIASDYETESSNLRNGRCTHPTHGHTTDEGGTPNMIVTDDGWYCYSHGTGGSVIDWIAVEENIIRCENAPAEGDDFYKALQAAAERADVELSGGSTPDDYEEAREDSTLSDEQKAEYALDEAVDILHDNLDTLIDGVSVRHYIKEQRPFDDEIIDNARIGYLDETVRGELMRRLSNDALEDIGFHRDNGSLHVRDRIIYPYTYRGRARFWVGRRTPESYNDDKYRKPASNTSVLQQPLYRYSPTVQAVRDGVWVTEGIQDAITLSEYGGVKAVSPVGTNASSKQIEQIISEGQSGSHVVVCYDDDAGGEKEAFDLMFTLMRVGIETRYASLGEGYDPCDYFADGNEFEDIDVTSATDAVLEKKGDAEPVITKLLDTVDPGTYRADKMVETISNKTGAQVTTLRDMLEQDPEFEDQTRFQDPSAVVKEDGHDPTFTFIYPGGEEIKVDSLAGQRAHLKFCDQYANQFNYIPDLTRSTFREQVNEWLQGGPRVREVDPLSTESQVREVVLRNAFSVKAHEKKEHVRSLKDGAKFYSDDGEILYVVNDSIREWIEDYDCALVKAYKFCEDVMAEDTKPFMFDGTRARFWPFDVEAVENKGYERPGTWNVEEEDGDSNGGGASV